MSKVYEVLTGLSPQLRKEAREIRDAMLASGDVVNWDRNHRLMIDNRSLPNKKYCGFGSASPPPAR